MISAGIAIALAGFLAITLGRYSPQSSISNLWYAVGFKYFYFIMATVGTGLGALAWFEESWLLAIAAISAPGVAAYGDFNGEDKIKHYQKALFVFVPILLFSGWEWLVGGVVLAGLITWIAKKNDLWWLELGLIALALVGIIINTI